MNVLSIFSGGVGIVGFAGLAVGYLGKSRDNEIIKAQAELVAVRDRQISDRDKEIAALTSRNEELTKQNSDLKDLAQGSPQLVELTGQIKALVAVVKKGHTGKRK